MKVVKYILLCAIGQILFLTFCSGVFMYVCKGLESFEHAEVAVRVKEIATPLIYGGYIMFGFQALVCLLITQGVIVVERLKKG